MLQKKISASNISVPKSNGPWAIHGGDLHLLDSAKWTFSLRLRVREAAETGTENEADGNGWLRKYDVEQQMNCDRFVCCPQPMITLQQSQ